MNDGPDRLSPRALERRLKRHLRREPQRFFAVGAPGFEAELEHEVRALEGATDLEVVRGGVAYTAELTSVYGATLQLRTAHRLYLRLREGMLAQTRTMLFDHLRRLPWELHLGFEAAWSLGVRSRASRLLPGDDVAGTVEDAVRARMEPLGLAPARREEAPLRFQLRLDRDRASMSFDTSGRHLHRRGYRLAIGEAPLRETLAAAIALAADVRRADLVFDPFCGSGTLVIEAALALAGAPVGALAAGEAPFGFEAAPWHRASMWARLQREAIEAIEPVAARIVAHDIDAGVLEAARANAVRAGVGEVLAFEAGDAFALPLDAVAAGAERPLLIANLPYGQRLGDRRAAADVAAALGAKLRLEGAGWRYAVVTADPEAFEGGLGEPPARRVPFRNGGLDVALLIGAAG